MSRIGKKIINVPQGVSLSVNGQHLTVKGSLGEEKMTLMEGISIDIQANVVHILADMEKAGKSNLAAAWGLSRSLVSNMVIGVSTGFTKELEIIGVGYRATQQGKDVMFQLGYSHNVTFSPPQGITVEVLEATKLRVKGTNKEQVGQVAANIRELRSPEPYKGKGIRYKEENVRKKAGKTGK